MTNFVARICSPTFSASPEWSISAKIVTPFASKVRLSLSKVSSTECLLGLLTIPLFAIAAIDASLRA